MPTRVDHFMYAVASLDEGLEWARNTFGVTPVYGGEHVGLGTRNALLSLGNCYLEIIAPDPAQVQTGTFGEQFITLSEGGLVTWAAEGQLTGLASKLAECGLNTLGPKRTQRQTTEGDMLAWDLLFPSDSPHGGRMPFFIDWLQCDNPKNTNPVAGEFQTLTISTPDAADLQRTLTAIGLAVNIEEGAPHLSVSITGHNGHISLTSTSETCRLRMF